MNVLEAPRRLYRRWRVLQYKGLTRGGWASLSTNRRAEAIGILTAMAPVIPLMISDELGGSRGWLWNAWFVVAIGWAVACCGVMMFHVVHDWRVVWRRYRRTKSHARNAR